MTVFNGILIILFSLLRFVVTLNCCNYIVDMGRKVKVGDVTVSSFLAKTACVCVTVISVFYNVVSVYVIVHLV